MRMIYKVKITYMMCNEENIIHHKRLVNIMIYHPNMTSDIEFYQPIYHQYPIFKKVVSSFRHQMIMIHITNIISNFEICNMIYNP